MKPVGRLVGNPVKVWGHVVKCEDCSKPDEGVPIYEENILPYRQSCAGCAKVLVEGRTPAWCELFTPEKESFAGGLTTACD